MKQITDELYNRLEYLGVIDNTGVRGRNFGASDYNEYIITPWAIWLDHPNLSVFKQMIIKYALREKDTDPEIMDLQKIIHYAQERIRQIQVKEKQEK